MIPCQRKTFFPAGIKSMVGGGLHDGRGRDFRATANLRPPAHEVVAIAHGLCQGSIGSSRGHVLGSWIRHRAALRVESHNLINRACLGDGKSIDSGFPRGGAPFISPAIGG